MAPGASGTAGEGPKPLRASPVKSRHFTGFSAAAREDANSRVRLGVHFPWDAEDGLTLGDKIVNHVFTTKVRAL